jgi:hypothetical protein
MTARFRPTAAACALAAVGSLAPPVLYFVVRPHVGGDAWALAFAAAVPLVLVVIAPLRRPVTGLLGVLTVAGFGLALAVTVVSGGSSLPFKLVRPLATATLGMACLVSVALRRPLLVALLRTLAVGYPERGGALERAASNPGARRRMSLLTGVVGVGFVAEGLITIALALTVSTGAFLVASRAARWTVLAVILAVLAGSVRLLRAEHDPEKPAVRDSAVQTTVDASPAGQRRTPSFTSRRFGVGWGRPQSWRARLILLAVVLLIVVIRLVLHV